MRPSDFYLPLEGSSGSVGTPRRAANVELLSGLRRGPLADKNDLEASVPLARVTHDELQKYGNDGGQEFDAEDIHEAIVALKAVVRRLGIKDFDVPFRDYDSFHSWWIDNGAYGSWQRRRDLLAKIFDPLHDRLALLEDEALSSSLADAISPHARTGWVAVDTEISELRRHFLNAYSPQDYRNVGLDCVAVTEALSAQVYNPALHLREGEDVPPAANTKARIERFIDDTASGSANAALRKLARSTIEFAQHVKHSKTPTRREAGIAADAVILLANILRRLMEPE